jgi:hypothetical protein
MHVVGGLAAASAAVQLSVEISPAFNELSAQLRRFPELVALVFVPLTKGNASSDRLRARLVNVTVPETVAKPHSRRATHSTLA